MPLLDIEFAESKMQTMSENKKTKQNILVVGAGNILLGDEGIGIHVIRELEKLTLPDNVEIMDIGVFSLSLISHITGKEKVIIIDALKSGGSPGSIYRLSVDNLEWNKKDYLSLHQLGIEEMLCFLKEEIPKEKIIIIGIEPGEIRWGMELSPCLKEKIPQIVKLVVEEIKRS
ncbi:MAG TPA: hydrogenase maturation protease [Candidatus Aerophobetes bacterium]|uniref:Hydrogenase maturation protease n=1 Tax=Aerophobetes bacterium TaxID=2030807 RepID=A0A7V5LZR1_UNCAE|nr:hydrogenase maturation protease [Candidatus Aerophobetes bacterium]